MRLKPSDNNFTNVFETERENSGGNQKSERDSNHHANRSFGLFQNDAVPVCQSRTVEPHRSRCLRSARRGAGRDMFLLALNNPKIIFFARPALFLNGLSNRTPFIHSVSIPKNASLSAVRRENRSERRKKLRRTCRKRLDAVGELCGKVKSSIENQKIP